MRLHLPKTLLAAVLAACASLDAYAGVSGLAFEINSTETNDSESMSGYATFAEGKYSSVNTDPTDKTAVTTIRPGDSTTGTIEVLNVASDKALSISANGTSNFTDLTISRINVAAPGSATLNIAGAQVVKIGGQSGTVNFSVSGAGAGELIFNGNGAYGNYSTSTNNYTRKIKVTNSSIVTFDTINNSWGMGAIDIDDASELKATSIILKSGDNKGGDLQGGKITGDGSANVTTLTVGNVGNYTINVANFEAGTLNADWVDASMQLTLSSSTLTIGTLNQTNGTIKITSATSAAITSLNISGGIIDASEMTGNLTISGATWTGNLTDASVEVLKAKDAATATSLANSMNTTHGLNYSFSVTESSVYRLRRTESLTSLTAKLEDSSAERKRIVVDATTDDGQTFTGVYLKDLLAGDKVTFGDISGWIGSGGETILADLEFSDGCTTHVTDGNANGKITYSGTITGSGTLSFDWYNTTTKQTYEFIGDLSRFTGQIRDDAVLSVTIGGTPATDAAKAVNATIDIAGALTVNREASFAEEITVGGALTVNRKVSFAKAITVGGKLIVKADSSIASGTVTGNMDLMSGALTINGNVTLKGALDMKGGETTDGACRGHLSVAKGGTLNVSGNGNIWVLKDTAKILLAEGGKLEWNGLTFTGKTAVENVETGLKFGKDEKLQLSTGEHTVTNSVITSTGTKTLSWTLTDTDLVVQSGTLRLGANVNASNVTVRNGSTLELVSEWTQSFTSANTNWEAGSTLKYVHTAPGMDAIDVVNLDSGVGSGATIELNGVKGTLKSVVSSIAADIKLTNSSVAAGEFTTIEGDSYTFDGKVKGGGNFVLAQASKTTSLIFNGDLSEWTSGSDTYSGLRVISGTVNATISGTPTNEEVKNAFNKDAGGTLNLTIDRDAVLTNKINITSLAVNTGKTLSLSDDNNAVAVGSTTVGDKAKLVIGNKGESTSINLGTVSGSGTISSEREATQSVTLGTGEDNAFTGTLEATAGQLNVTAKTVQTLAGLKANGGNIDVMNATSLSVTDMVIGDNATVGVYSGADTTTEPSLNIYGSVNSKASLTIGSDATLNANLTVSYAKLNFSGEPLVMGSTLTLFADGTSELLGIDLSTVTATGLTLFTGVDGFSTGFDSASANAVTIDDAHDIFGNLTAGAYSLKYTGGTNGDVLLIANNPTPEPTTATLSLLALMGLAARRRRKA